MALPIELQAKRGDWILPYWRALLAYIERTAKIERGPGVRFNNLPGGGIYIYADDNFNPWSSPFKVTVTGTRARIREGAVNAVTPTLGGVRINGLDESGESVAVPSLELEPPGNGRRSFIALRLSLSTPDIPEDDLEAATIVHIEERPNLFTQGGSAFEDGVALYPLAALYWKGKSVSRSFQIVHHNLGHRFVEGSGASGKPSRHLFWAA